MVGGRTTHRPVQSSRARHEDHHMPASLCFLFLFGPPSLWSILIIPPLPRRLAVPRQRICHYVSGKSERQGARTARDDSSSSSSPPPMVDDPISSFTNVLHALVGTPYIHRQTRTHAHTRVRKPGGGHETWVIRGHRHKPASPFRWYNLVWVGRQAGRQAAAGA